MGMYVASAIPCSCHPERHTLQVGYGSWGVDFPVQYADGTIVYDWPERVPQAAKRLVERAFAAAK